MAANTDSPHLDREQDTRVESATTMVTGHPEEEMLCGIRTTVLNPIQFFLPQPFLG
ncbi:hypothetical protein RIB2604_02110740 [Aspergillus luchuensis]|uniref:Uncharacterized protein n=1 Tax=Aspergillus kawachii TaxID=1069201 RepID=A0A146FQP8_ASPKA|nr:hypothetical protein RIB2604_02110740 [Aspergillus luchuensis]